MVVRNVGQVPVQWFVENSEIIQSTVPWLHFSPFDGTLIIKQVTNHEDVIQDDICGK